MNTAAAEASLITPIRSIPVFPLNTYWPGRGGKFRGIVPGTGGAPDRLLFEHVEELPIGNWEAAKKAAAGIEADGHKDFALPTRVESALLYAVAKAEHKTDNWYWTSEPDGSGYAWCQHFDDGGQNCNRQDRISIRACAVRSEPIQ